MKIPQNFYKYVSVLYTKSTSSKKKKHSSSVIKLTKSLNRRIVLAHFHLMKCHVLVHRRGSGFPQAVYYFCFIAIVPSWSLRRSRFTLALFWCLSLIPALLYTQTLGKTNFINSNISSIVLTSNGLDHQLSGKTKTLTTNIKDKWANKRCHYETPQYRC